MRFTGIVENCVIKLLPGLHLPDGTEVEVLIPDRIAGLEMQMTLYERMIDFIGCIKDGPEDLAAEHDYYAHGAPKKSAAD